MLYRTYCQWNSEGCASVPLPLCALSPMLVLREDPCRMECLEGPDEYISLARAAQIAGLSPGTLRNQALKGKLNTVQVARNNLTTRRWLHEYLHAADAAQGGRRKPLPEGYVAPE